MQSLKRHSIISRAAVALIKSYQRTLSPNHGIVSVRTRCRFWPSCSVYAAHCIEQYGATVGTWKAFWRVLRCNPWSPGGIDPVR